MTRQPLAQLGKLQRKVLLALARGGSILYTEEWINGVYKESRMVIDKEGDEYCDVPLTVMRSLVKRDLIFNSGKIYSAEEGANSIEQYKYCLRYAYIELITKNPHWNT